MSHIRDIRSKLGLTQSELADRLGLHQTSVSRMEGGKLPVDERTELALEALVARSQAKSESNTSAAAHCSLCNEARAEGEVAACTAVDCPLRQQEAA